MLTTVHDLQWRRQRSKGARPFRGQLRTSSSLITRMHFFLKKVDDFLVVALKTQRPPTPLRLFHCQTVKTKQIKRSAVDLPARSFDLARPGVAPPLMM